MNNISSLSHSSDDELQEQLRKIIDDSDDEPKKKNLFDHEIRPLKLRPSIVQRAIKKNVISSTPLNRRTEKFFPSDSSYSPIGQSSVDSKKNRTRDTTPVILIQDSNSQLDVLENKTHNDRVLRRSSRHKNTSNYKSPSHSINKTKSRGSVSLKNNSTTLKDNNAINNTKNENFSKSSMKENSIPNCHKSLKVLISESPEINSKNQENILETLQTTEKNISYQNVTLRTKNLVNTNAEPENTLVHKISKIPVPRTRSKSAEKSNRRTTSNDPQRKNHTYTNIQHTLEKDDNKIDSSTAPNILNILQLKPNQHTLQRDDQNQQKISLSKDQDNDCDVSQQITSFNNHRNNTRKDQQNKAKSQQDNCTNTSKNKIATSNNDNENNAKKEQQNNEDNCTNTSKQSDKNHQKNTRRDKQSKAKTPSTLQQDNCGNTSQSKVPTSDNDHHNNTSIDQQNNVKLKQDNCTNTSKQSDNKHQKHSRKDKQSKVKTPSTLLQDNCENKIPTSDNDHQNNTRMDKQNKAKLQQDNCTNTTPNKFPASDNHQSDKDKATNMSQHNNTKQNKLKLSNNLQESTSSSDDDDDDIPSHTMNGILQKRRISGSSLVDVEAKKKRLSNCIDGILLKKTPMQHLKNKEVQTSFKKLLSIKKNALLNLNHSDETSGSSGLSNMVNLSEAGVNIFDSIAPGSPIERFSSFYNHNVLDNNKNQPWRYEASRKSPDFKVSRFSQNYEALLKIGARSNRRSIKRYNSTKSLRLRTPSLSPSSTDTTLTEDLNPIGKVIETLATPIHDKSANLSSSIPVNDKEVSIHNIEKWITHVNSRSKDLSHKKAEVRHSKRSSALGSKRSTVLSSRKSKISSPKKSTVISPQRSAIFSPKRSIVPSPKKSTNLGPQKSTVDSPQRSTTLSPQRSTTLSPQRSPVHSPRKSTVHSPRRSTVHSPRRSTVHSPRRSTVHSPRRSTVHNPQKSPVHSPQRYTVHCPRHSRVNSPRQSTVHSPRRSTVRSPRRSTVLSPQRSRIISQRSPDHSILKSTVHSPRQSKIRSPQRPTVRSPRRPTVRSPRRSTVRSPQISTVQSPQRSIVHSPPRSTVRSPRISKVQSPPRSTVRSSRQSTVHSPRRSTVRSPRRSTVRSPRRSSVHSPRRSTVRSPRRSTVHSPRRSTVHSPQISSVLSNERSKQHSPPRSTVHSPRQSTVRSPRRSTVHSPQRSSLLSNDRSKQARNKSFTSRRNLFNDKDRVNETESQLNSIHAVQEDFSTQFKKPNEPKKKRGRPPKNTKNIGEKDSQNKQVEPAIQVNSRPARQRRPPPKQLYSCISTTQSTHFYSLFADSKLMIDQEKVIPIIKQRASKATSFASNKSSISHKSKSNATHQNESSTSYNKSQGKKRISNAKSPKFDKSKGRNSRKIRSSASLAIREEHQTVQDVNPNLVGEANYPNGQMESSEAPGIPNNPNSDIDDMGNNDNQTHITHDDNHFLQPSTSKPFDQDSGRSTLIKSSIDENNVKSVRPPRKTKNRRSVRGRAKKHNKSVSNSQKNETMTPGDQSMYNNYIDLPMGDTVSRLKYCEKDATFTAMPDKLLYSDALSHDGKSVVYLQIPPGQSKPPHSSRKHDLFYIVVEGTGNLIVKDKMSSIERLSRMLIPVGFPYSIENNNESENLLLACMRIPIT